MDRREAARPGERLFALLMLGLALFLLWRAYGIDGLSALSSPGAFPIAVAAVMTLSALIVAVGVFRRPSAGPLRVVFVPPVGQGAAPVLLLFCGLVLAYALALRPLGFLPSSGLFLFAAFQLLRRGPVLRNAALALLSLAAVYAIFRLLFEVVLPEGIVPEREIIAWAERLLSGPD